MLTEESKQTIRDAYAKLVKEKSLSPRLGQRQMIAEIARALGRISEEGDSAGEDKPAVAVIEAGTGTGKTIAYSVAAIPLAQALDKRLVIATATVALQEQLMGKDLPDIRARSGLAFSTALAKGRRRYLCLSKLDRIMSDAGSRQGTVSLYPDEEHSGVDHETRAVYEAMMEALMRGEWDGDRDNWPDALNEPVWSAVTTDHNQCSGRRCPNIGQCSFFTAREALQQADVVVTNHDLVLADLTLGGGAILPAPEDTIYVFDEGHHLPAKALSHFAAFTRLRGTSQWLQECQDYLGRAAGDMAALQDLRAPLAGLTDVFGDLRATLAVAESVLEELFAELPEGDDGELRIRFPHGAVPEPLRETALPAAKQFNKLAGALERMQRTVESALEDNIAGLDKSVLEVWHAALGAMQARADGNLALWEDFCRVGEAEDSPHARWITRQEGRGQVEYELRGSPVLASDILREHLWPRAAGVVVTSATMTALNSFERFILHSGVPREAAFAVVPSPFDFSRATLHLPFMGCDGGNAAAHTEEVTELLPRIIDPAEASLVLFASRRQMLAVYQELPRDLRSLVLVQGDYSKQETLRRHREAVDSGEGSVIFGLASFAEGVDLPGRYCSHVIIAKIPFAVPDSPLEAALAEWMESQGRNAFMEISVPDAALRLLQACGRLLRTEQDEGRVTLLDRRVLTRRYGRAILDSLPPFRRRIEENAA